MGVTPYVVSKYHFSFFIPVSEGGTVVDERMRFIK